MAIGKRPSTTPKTINLESPEVQNFINSGVVNPSPQKEEPAVIIENVKEIPEAEPAEKQEAKRGRKKSIETTNVKYYNLPIPEELFEGIEDYIYKNRKKKKVTIRAFIVNCIKKELERENLI